MKINYELNNPMQKSKVIKDSQALFGKENIILFCPDRTYTFDDSVDALCYIFYSGETQQETFLESYLDYSGIYISCPSGTYILRKLSDINYKYRPETDKKFAEDTDKKIEYMTKEFQAKFSAAELERQMEHQALSIVNGGFHTSLEDKFKDFLDKYFYGKWDKFTVESRELSPIATEYTLKVFGKHRMLFDLTKNYKMFG